MSHGAVCGWRACGGEAAVMATGVAVRGRCWVMRLQDEWTAVMLAAQNGHESTVGLLLDRGADVAAKTPVSGSKRKLDNGCAEPHDEHLQVPPSLGVGQGLAEPDSSSLLRGWTVPGRS